MNFSVVLEGGMFSLLHAYVSIALSNVACESRSKKKKKRCAFSWADKIIAYWFYIWEAFMVRKPVRICTHDVNLPNSFHVIL